MKINKGISVLLSGVLMSGMLVGCSSEFDSTEYLDEQGKEIIKKYENREKYNYIKVEELDYLNRYEDEYIMITGKVTDIDKNADNGNSYEISFDFEENHTTAFIRVFVQKNMIDVKFNKGDIITVYGKCYGIRTKRYDDKSFDYWHINAYFLELGDTTDKEKTIKKDDVEAKATEDKEDKEVEDKKIETAKDKEEEKAPSQDNNKSNEKQIDTKKDNDNSTKEKPKKKDTNTKKNTKEEPKKKGYYVTCPNGHKIYTENGDWDCIECDDDWQEQQEEPDNSDYEDEEYEPGYIKDGTHLEENNPDESIEVIEDPEYYE